MMIKVGIDINVYKFYSVRLVVVFKVKVVNVFFVEIM